MTIIHWKSISSVIGSLLFIECALFALCQGVGLFFHEYDTKTFVIPFALALTVGFMLKVVGRRSENKLNRRDAYLILSSTWVVFSIFGMLPFLISGATSDVSAAFLETMSGFTTTGATVLDNIESLPHSLLFWRSLMHWIGGLGIVFFTLAILPSIGMSDIKLFSAESTGFKVGKLHPRFSVAAKWLWSLYFTLTLSCIAAYYLAGMDLFDSIAHALSTLGTGGFSTRQASIAAFQSPIIEYVAGGFMFLAGINFALLYLLIIKRHWRDVFTDVELRTYVLVALSATLVIALSLIIMQGYDIEPAFRHAFFHVISVQTTSGFMAADPMLWPTVTILVLIIVMIVGGSAGSTAGGYKCIRLYTIFKYARNELIHQLHPRAVLQVRFGKGECSTKISNSLMAFSFLFVCLLTVGTILFVLTGLPILDAFTVSASSLSNVGPAFGSHIGATDSWAELTATGKWLASFLMLAGRLEIFSVLLPFYHHFWKEN